MNPHRYVVLLLDAQEGAAFGIASHVGSYWGFVGKITRDLMGLR